MGEAWLGAVVAWDAVAGTAFEGRLARTLAEAGADVVGGDWRSVALRAFGEGRGLLVADEHCPTTGPAVVRRVVEAADSSGRPHLPVRGVTDTLKQLEGGVLGETVDREQHVTMCTPLAVPAAAVPLAIELLDEVEGPEEMFLELGARMEVVFLRLDDAGPRAADESDLAVLLAGG